MSPTIRVTSAEFVRHFGNWQDRAGREPIIVTHHGRERLIVLSAERFSEMAANDAAGDNGTCESLADTSLEIVAEQLGDCLICFGADLRIRFVNAALCAYVQLPRAELIGRTIEEAVPQARGSLGQANVAQALISGQMTTLDTPSVIYPDRWLRVRTFPMPGGSGCLFRDVTEEVEGRQSAGILSATRQALLSHGLIGRCILNVRAVIREADPAFAALLGLEADGLLRARFTDIVPAGCRVAVRECIETVLETNKACTLDTQLLRQGHIEQAVRLGLAPLAGTPERGVVVVAAPRS